MSCRTISGNDMGSSGRVKDRSGQDRTSHLISDKEGQGWSGHVSSIQIWTD